MTSAPAAEPETSKTTSAPAPPVRSRMAACGSVAVGSMTSSPSSAASSAAEGADLAQRHLCPLRPGDEADEQPDRTASDHHDGLVGDDLTAPHVVAGDCEWLDERGQPQVDRRRQSVKREGGHGPRALERTGGIDAEELEPAADVAEALVGGRLGRGCRAGERRRGHRRRSRRRPGRALRRCPTSRDRSPAVREPCGPCDRGRCGRRCHRRRRTRRRAGPRPAPGDSTSLSPTVNRPRALVVDRRHAVSASSASSMCLSHCSPSDRWMRSAALARSASWSRSAS